MNCKNFSLTYNNKLITFNLTLSWIFNGNFSSIYIQPAVSERVEW